ncbi:hypothetical protein [Pontibacter russatus]|uniref:hypothetical protein n=1 Tax=Pontibacter russatus TaxID=2694929 RepID=UPI00137B6B31|nr:hypothetical protein [Pontibacter russatus]
MKNIGTFAFEVGKGSTDNEFSYNTISHIGAGGSRVNGGTDEVPPVLWNGNNVISDNELHHFGEVYPSAVGLLLMQTYGNRVAHNNIYNGWYQFKDACLKNHPCSVKLISLLGGGV